MRNQVQIQACTLVDCSFLFICLICYLAVIILFTILLNYSQTHHLLSGKIVHNKIIPSATVRQCMLS